MKLPATKRARLFVACATLAVVTWSASAGAEPLTEKHFPNGIPSGHPRIWWNDARLAQAKTWAAAHSFEGKVFNLVSSGVLDQEAIDKIARGNSEIKEFLEKSARPSSFITGPNGEQIAEIAGEEGIVYADIDLSESIIPKQAQDIVGYYNRFDIFQLQINQTPHRPITCYEREASAPATMDSDIWNSENTGEEKERNEGGK